MPSVYKLNIKFFSNYELGEQLTVFFPFISIKTVHVKVRQWVKYPYNNLTQQQIKNLKSVTTVNYNKTSTTSGPYNLK